MKLLKLCVLGLFLFSPIFVAGCSNGDAVEAAKKADANDPATNTDPANSDMGPGNGPADTEASGKAAASDPAAK